MPTSRPTTDVLSLHASLAAAPATVYRALTDAAALAEWLADHAEIDLAAGRFAFWGRQAPWGDRPRQRLLAAEPGRALRFAWTLECETTAEVELAASERGTTVEVRQTGVPTLEELMVPTGPRDGVHSLHTFWPLALAHLAEYVEGRERTPGADFGPDRAAEIRVELDIAAPPERVFASLVDPDQVARWWGYRIEVEPRVGGRIELGADGEVTEYDPGRVLAYADEGGAITRWELAGSQGRTHLTFVQSGFGADELDDAAQHEAGWLAGLAELRRMHELGADWEPLIRELPDEGESDRS